MKNGLILLLVIFSLSACVKPNAPLTPVPNIWTWTGSNPMSVYVNGNLWQAGSAAYADAGTFKVVSGDDGTGSMITITSTDFSVGSISPLYFGIVNSNASYVINSGEVCSSATGTEGACKILENDATHIKGLFYFSTKAPISGSPAVLTKGYFNITK